MKGVLNLVSPPLLKTPHEEKQESTHSLIKNILGGDYIFLQFDNIKIQENLKTEKTYITCSVAASEDFFLIEAEGDGIVDALFSTLLENFSSTFLSLREIFLEGFSVEAQFNSYSKKNTKTDAEVEARLLIKNKAKTEFIFRYVSTSMISAAIHVIKETFEYFLNSERAVEILFLGIEDARRRNRQDLAEIYIGQLSELVKNVCYTSKLVALREELMNEEED
jgi:hypothetical protein